MRETLYVSTKGNIDIVPRRVSGYTVYPSLNEAARSLHVICVRQYKDRKRTTILVEHILIYNES